MVRKFLTGLLALALLFSPVYSYADRWASKPPVGSRINFSHPLSKGLVGCWLMNEGRGNIVSNICSSKAKGILSGGNFSTGSKGSFIAFDGTNTKILMDSPLLNPTQKPFTVISCIFTSSLSTAQYILNANDAGGTRTWTILYFGSDPSKALQLQQIGSTNLIIKSASNYFPSAGIYYTMACSHTGSLIASEFKVYRNGINIGLGAGTDGVTLTSASGGWNISGRTSDTNFRLQGGMTYFYFYNRVLSPQEIMSLYVDPYQFIEKPSWIERVQAVVDAYTGWIGVNIN